MLKCSLIIVDFTSTINLWAACIVNYQSLNLCCIMFSVCSHLIKHIKVKTVAVSSYFDLFCTGKAKKLIRLCGCKFSLELSKQNLTQTIFLMEHSLSLLFQSNQHRKDKHIPLCYSSKDWAAQCKLLATEFCPISDPFLDMIYITLLASMAAIMWNVSVSWHTEWNINIQ